MEIIMGNIIDGLLKERIKLLIIVIFYRIKYLAINNNNIILMKFKFKLNTSNWIHIL